MQRLYYLFNSKEIINLINLNLNSNHFLYRNLPKGNWLRKASFTGNRGLLYDTTSVIDNSSIPFFPLVSVDRCLTAKSLKNNVCCVHLCCVEVVLWLHLTTRDALTTFVGEPEAVEQYCRALVTGFRRRNLLHFKQSCMQDEAMLICKKDMAIYFQQSKFPVWHI